MYLDLTILGIYVFVSYSQLDWSFKTWNWNSEEGNWSITVYSFSILSSIVVVQLPLNWDMYHILWIETSLETKNSAFWFCISNTSNIVKCYLAVYFYSDISMIDSNSHCGAFLVILTNCPPFIWAILLQAEGSVSS